MKTPSKLTPKSKAARVAPSDEQYIKDKYGMTVQQYLSEMVARDKAGQSGGSSSSSESSKTANDLVSTINDLGGKLVEKLAEESAQNRYLLENVYLTVAPHDEKINYTVETLVSHRRRELTKTGLIGLKNKYLYLGSENEMVKKWREEAGKIDKNDLKGFINNKLKEISRGITATQIRLKIISKYDQYSAVLFPIEKLSEYHNRLLSAKDMNAEAAKIEAEIEEQIAQIRNENV